VVQIACPHCKEHIELDDDASGLFACPCCEGEFEWGDDHVDEADDEETTPKFNFSSVVSGVLSGSLFLTSFSLIFVSLVLFQISGICWEIGKSSSSEFAALGGLLFLILGLGGYILSGSIFLLGFSLLLTGLLRMLRR